MYICKCIFIHVYMLSKKLKLFLQQTRLFGKIVEKCSLYKNFKVFQII